MYRAYLALILSLSVAITGCGDESSELDVGGSDSSTNSGGDNESSVNTTSTLSLNDTGTAWCASNTLDEYTCPISEYPGQDADFGRDAQEIVGELDKVGGGQAGFDFTKLDADGNDLPYVATSWSCVRDNNTGLTWETKSNDGGLQDQYSLYSWYNPDPESNGGNEGYQSLGSCSGSACDTAAFANAVNAKALCGIQDWRLPVRKELLSIAHNSGDGTAIDSNYFPYTPTGSGTTPKYWTNTPVSSNLAFPYVWVVDFGDGSVEKEFVMARIRLVSGTRYQPQGEDGCDSENKAIRTSTPTDAFTLFDDGTALHKATDLMWARCVLGQDWNGTGCIGNRDTYGWQDALSLAQDSTYAGYDDWRIPSKNELESIVDERCDRPSVNTVVFRDTPKDWFLTSTPTEDLIFGDGHPWLVDFKSGIVSPASYVHDNYARLVRD